MNQQGFLNSSNQFIQLLKEKDHDLNIIGLQQLLTLVDTHWHEISEHLDTIEEFYENEKFPERNLAAFIASKIYFNLEEHQEALDLAIKSGNFFKLDENSLFVEQLINTCISIYIKNRQHNYENSANPVEQLPISKDYEQIVEHMFEKSIRQNNYKHVIGIAVESRRIDTVQKVLEIDGAQNPDNNELLQYLFDISVNLIENREFRISILKLITEFYKAKQLTGNDYLNQCLCYFCYDDFESVAAILNNLISTQGDLQEQNVLIAYQIANEISENENQFFINRVISAFPIESNNQELTQYRNNLVRLLTGEIRKNLNQTFLTTNNFADPQLILKLKEIANQKQSIALGGVALTNGILHAGTNDQSFIDKNYEWLKSATFWNKFSTVASLGVINKGTKKSGKQVFADFIPGSTSQAGQGKNPNANGGSLYGMGLLHEGSKNQETIDYLVEVMKDPQHQQNETIVHGAALGLGLVGLASEDQLIYEHLQNILNTSQSVSGESAGIAMGLVMAGSGNELAIEELLNFAHETDRDKIVRACAIALAMIVFGKEQSADTLIEQLAQDKDGILRYGACMALGMAYVGSGNKNAIKRLLNFAVTDVSDDVRRISVISLAFVMFKIPEEYLKMVKLLSISYSPHVRYGTALGIGIACAGSCNSDAYELLEPLLTDTTPFVKQAAYMGTALLFQLANKNSEPKLEKFNKMLEESYSKKSEDPIVKMGAQLATGILQNGGQNSVIKLASQQGFPRLGACVSMLAFTHFWHWYPLVHFYNLTLQPSAIIGVNQNFRIPKTFEFKSNVRPILTDYIPHIKKDEDQNKTKKETVNLSTTTRAKARQQLKESQKDGESSKIDNSQLKKFISKEESVSKRKEQSQIEQEKKEEKMEIEEQKKKDDVNFKIFSNPSRVLDRFKKNITYIEGARYIPIIQERKSGIIFLKDTQKDQPEEFIGEDILNQKAGAENNQAQSNNNSQDNEPDVQPPEDFIFDPAEQNK